MNKIHTIALSLILSSCSVQGVQENQMRDKPEKPSNGFVGNGQSGSSPSFQEEEADTGLDQEFEDAGVLSPEPVPETEPGTEQDSGTADQNNDPPDQPDPVFDTCPSGYAITCISNTCMCLPKFEMQDAGVGNPGAQDAGSTNTTDAGQTNTTDSGQTNTEPIDGIGNPGPGNPKNPYNKILQTREQTSCSITQPTDMWSPSKPKNTPCSFDDLRGFYDAYIGAGQAKYKQLSFEMRKPGCYECLVSTPGIDEEYGPVLLSPEGNMLINWASATSKYSEFDNDEEEVACSMIEFNLTECQQYECWQKEPGTEFYNCVRFATNLMGACSKAYFSAFLAAGIAGDNPPTSTSEDERTSFVNMAWRTCGR